jgi:hypothetical protein
MSINRNRAQLKKSHNSSEYLRIFVKELDDDFFGWHSIHNGTQRRQYRSWKNTRNNQWKSKK